MMCLLLPNQGLKLPGRLAALARSELGLHTAGNPKASAANAPARSLNLIR